jgi:DNA adenine methylase
MPPAIADRAALSPPLKWAGGKRWQLPHLRSIWALHRQRRLVEPFCGGLAVALGLAPDRALLNDANRHLINFYRWLQRGLTIDLPMENDKASYYQARSRFNALITVGKSRTREAASLFYYLNRTGYNGLCRFSQQGKFNVPFGKYDAIRYSRDFTAYVSGLADWRFSNVDFSKLEIDADDFVYADPPYDVPFTHYSTRGFSWDDQERAAIFCAAHRGPVVLVNQATARIEKLYRDLGFSIARLKAPRRISCTGDRTPAREIMSARNL